MKRRHFWREIPYHFINFHVFQNPLSTLIQSVYNYHELFIFKESSNADNNDSCDVGEYFISVTCCIRRKNNMLYRIYYIVNSSIREFIHPSKINTFAKKNNLFMTWKVYCMNQRCKFFCVFRNLRANCDCDCEFTQSQRNRNRFLKKIAVAAQSQSIISARNFSQIANCAQFAIISQFAICDFFSTATCAQFAIFSQFAICDFLLTANCAQITNCEP